MLRKNVYLIGAVSLAVALFCGCRVSARQPIVSPSRPPAARLSELNINTTVPLVIAQNAANRAVPGQIGITPYNAQDQGGADNCCKGVSYGYQVNRGQITLSPQGNAISATTELHYWLKAQVRCPCLVDHIGPVVRASCGVGESPPALSATLRTTFNGIGPDWSPRISTSLADIHALNACNIVNILNIVKVDVRRDVVDAASGAITRSLPSLDQSLSRALNLRDRAQQFWNYLSQPIQLQKDVWLSVHPKAIGAFPLEGNSQSLNWGIRLTGQPELSFSNVKPPTETSPLPAPSPVVSSNAFSVQVPVEAGYDFASEQIDKDLHLATNGMRYPPTGSPYITITGADVYGYGTKAVLRIDGRISGIFGKRVTVYLQGTPTFNSGTDVLTFPDLQFSVDSHNLLLKIAVWLDQANLQRDLRNRMVVDLSKQVNQARARLQSALNQSIGSAALAGNINELALLDIYSNPENRQFSALFQTNGTLNITFH